jgi:mRNA interferase MazF
MRRGEIRLVDLDPVRGEEANKQRPAVIVSNDGANSTADRLGRGVVTVVPATSNIDRVYPFQVLLRASAGRAGEVRSRRTRRITRRRRTSGASPLA